MRNTAKQFFETVRPLLEAGRTVSFYATGSSMEPFISHGDKIEVRRRQSYRRGDIVLARTDGGTVVLHSVIRLDSGSVTLMGTANLHKTETCQYGDISGAVTAVTHGSVTHRCSTKRWRTAMTLWLSLRPLRRAMLCLYRTMLR